MAFKFVTADERLQETGIKGVIFGPAKIGKTSLLWTLDPATTLWLDLEAGGLSVQGWQGTSIEIQSWEQARDIAVLLGGPNPNRLPHQAYSENHFNYAVHEFGQDPTEAFSKFKTIFVDSITVAGRLSFNWCHGQPDAVSEKTGNKNTRGIYGLHGQEMISWLTHLQHVKGKNVWFVGLLDQKEDDFGRRFWSPQIEGSKTGLELPGIVDQVISMVELPDSEGNPYRAFVCRRPNPWGFPAGDRSGRLAMVEEPHLGRLMEKIKGPVCPAPERLEYTMPEKGQEERHVA